MNNVFLCFNVEVFVRITMEDDLREQEKFFMNGGVPSVEIIREGAEKNKSAKDPSKVNKTPLPPVSPVSSVGAIQEHRVVREKRDVVVAPVEHGFPQAEVIDVSYSNVILSVDKKNEGWKEIALQTVSGTEECEECCRDQTSGGARARFPCHSASFASPYGPREFYGRNEWNS